MDRDEFSRTFYGEGPVPPPWATDCPVKFEVWWEYAQPLGHPVDLILALGEQHIVANVFEHVRNFAPIGGGVEDRRPVLSGGYIAVKLTFAELIAIVLPLTTLGRKIGSARKVVSAWNGTVNQALRSIIAGDAFEVPESTESAPPTDWEPLRSATERSSGANICAGS
jgi:hypothetical protein